MDSFTVIVMYYFHKDTSNDQYFSITFQLQFLFDEIIWFFNESD